MEVPFVCRDGKGDEVGISLHLTTWVDKDIDGEGVGVATLKKHLGKDAVDQRVVLVPSME